MRLSTLGFLAVAAGCGSGIHGNQPDGRVDAVIDGRLDSAPDATPDATIVHTGKQMFVTSLAYQGGSLGGLAGADDKCAMRATAAGLAGTFKAWLSDTVTSPSTRFTQSTGEYRLPDGTLVAASWTDLVHSNLVHEVNVDETGAPYVLPTGASICNTKTVAWTATKADGTPINGMGTDFTCTGWTVVTGNGATGNVNKSDGQWTDSGCANICSQKTSLYCVEQ